MREKIDQGLERQPHPHILPPPSPRGQVNRLWILALGFAMCAGLGCEPHLGAAKFCHNVTVDGQPAVLDLVQMLPEGAENKFTTATGTCSPCSRLKLDNTFKFELREKSGQVLSYRYFFIPAGPPTYVMSAVSDPDGTLRLNAQSYPGGVACRRIPDPVTDGGTSSLRLEDGEQAEDPASWTPDDSSEPPQH